MKEENCSETNRITEVTSGGEYWTISQGGLCCGLKKKYGIEPKKGDMLTVHTKGGTFGTIRGMDLNGKRIFWKTDEELEAARIEWLRKNEEDKQEKFKKNKSDMDARYNALPECFKLRIDKFRQHNDRFRIDYEDYELFCCEQAVVIAKGCKTADGVKDFREKKWDDQVKMVPELSSDHSGNTFGAAVTMAFWYLQQPENVIKLHGALSPLVGSEEYGDVPSEKEKK